jgi:hypothetical protein
MKLQIMKVFFPLSLSTPTCSLLSPKIVIASLWIALNLRVSLAPRSKFHTRMIYLGGKCEEYCRLGCDAVTFYQTTRCHIPEYDILEAYYNLKRIEENKKERRFFGQILGRILYHWIKVVYSFKSPPTFRRNMLSPSSGLKSKQPLWEPEIPLKYWECYNGMKSSFFCVCGPFKVNWRFGRNFASIFRVKSWVMALESSADHCGVQTFTQAVYLFYGFGRNIASIFRVK